MADGFWRTVSGALNLRGSQQAVVDEGEEQALKEQQEREKRLEEARQLFEEQKVVQQRNQDRIAQAREWFDQAKNAAGNALTQANPVARIGQDVQQLQGQQPQTEAAPATGADWRPYPGQDEQAPPNPYQTGPQPDLGQSAYDAQANGATNAPVQALPQPEPERPPQPIQPAQPEMPEQRGTPAWQAQRQREAEAEAARRAAPADEGPAQVDDTGAVISPAPRGRTVGEQEQAAQEARDRQRDVETGFQEGATATTRALGGDADYRPDKEELTRDLPEAPTTTREVEELADRQGGRIDPMADEDAAYGRGLQDVKGYVEEASGRATNHPQAKAPDVPPELGQGQQGGYLAAEGAVAQWVGSPAQALNAGMKFFRGQDIYGRGQSGFDRLMAAPELLTAVLTMIAPFKGALQSARLAGPGMATNYLIGQGVEPEYANLVGNVVDVADPGEALDVANLGRKAEQIREASRLAKRVNAYAGAAGAAGAIHQGIERGESPLTVAGNALDAWDSFRTAGGIVDNKAARTAAGLAQVGGEAAITSAQARIEYERELARLRGQAQGGPMEDEDRGRVGPRTRIATGRADMRAGGTAGSPETLGAVTQNRPGAPTERLEGLQDVGRVDVPGAALPGRIGGLPQGENGNPRLVAAIQADLDRAQDEMDVVAVIHDITNALEQGDLTPQQAAPLREAVRAWQAPGAQAQPQAEPSREEPQTAEAWDQEYREAIRERNRVFQEARDAGRRPADDPAAQAADQAVRDLRARAPSAQPAGVAAHEMQPAQGAPVPGGVQVLDPIQGTERRRFHGRPGEPAQTASQLGLYTSLHRQISEAARPEHFQSFQERVDEFANRGQITPQHALDLRGYLTRRRAHMGVDQQIADQADITEAPMLTEPDEALREAGTQTQNRAYATVLDQMEMAAAAQNQEGRSTLEGLQRTLPEPATAGLFAPAQHQALTRRLAFLTGGDEGTAAVGRPPGPQQPGEAVPARPRTDVPEPPLMRPELGGKAPAGERPGVWYSQMERVLQQKFRQPKMQAAQVRQLLLGNGVKKEELFWTGVGEALDNAEEMGAPIQRDELIALAQTNRLPLAESVLGYRLVGATTPEARAALENEVRGHLMRAVMYGEDPDIRDNLRDLAGPHLDAATGAPRTDEEYQFRQGIYERLLTMPTEDYMTGEELAPDAGYAERAVAWLHNLDDFTHNVAMLVGNQGRGAAAMEAARRDLNEAVRPIRRRVYAAVDASQKLKEEYAPRREGQPEHASYGGPGAGNYTLRAGAKRANNPRESLLQVRKQNPDAARQMSGELAGQRQDVAEFSVGAHFGGREGIFGSGRTHDDVLADGRTTVHSNEDQSDIQQRGRKSGTWDRVAMAAAWNQQVPPGVAADVRHLGDQYERVARAEGEMARTLRQQPDPITGTSRTTLRRAKEDAEQWAHRVIYAMDSIHRIEARMRRSGQDPAVERDDPNSAYAQKIAQRDAPVPASLNPAAVEYALAYRDLHILRSDLSDKYGGAMTGAEDAQANWIAYNRAQVQEFERRRLDLERRAQAAYRQEEAGGAEPEGVTEGTILDGAARALYTAMDGAQQHLDTAASNIPPGAPRAPFPDNTVIEKLVERQLRDAVDRGAEAISWSTGQVIARRWSAGRIAERVAYDPSTQTLTVNTRNQPGNPSHQLTYHAAPNQVADYVGPDAARHLTDPANGGQDGVAVLAGDDMMVMDSTGRVFVQQYDRTMVSIANRIAKQFGVQVEKTRLQEPEGHDPSEDPDLEAWALPINDALRKRVQEGFALYHEMTPESGASPATTEGQTETTATGEDVALPPAEQAGPAELGGPEAAAELAEPPGATPSLNPPPPAPWRSPRAADEDAAGKLPGESDQQTQSRHQRERRVQYQRDVGAGRVQPVPHVRDINARQRALALEADPQAQARSQQQTDALVGRIMAGAQERAATGEGSPRIVEEQAVRKHLEAITKRFQALAHRDHTLDLEQTEEGRDLLTRAQQPKTVNPGKKNAYVVPGVAPAQINEAIWRYLGRQPGVEMQNLEAAPQGLTQQRGRRGALEGAPEMRAKDFQAILQHLGLQRTESEGGSAQADTSVGKFKYVDSRGREQTADSSSEVVFMRQLDRDPNVLYWQKSLGGAGEGWVPISTRYAEEATYAPDYFVVSRNPKTGALATEVIEVKNMGAFRQDAWRVPEKTNAARRFYTKLGIGFRIFNEDQLGGYDVGQALTEDDLAGVQGYRDWPDAGDAKREILRRVKGAFVKGGEMMARMEAAQFNSASGFPTTVTDLSQTAGVARMAEHLHRLLAQGDASTGTGPGEGLTYNPRTGETLGHLLRWFVSVVPDFELQTKGRLGGKPEQGTLAKPAPHPDTVNTELGNGPNEFEVARFLAKVKPLLDRYPFLNVGVWYNPPEQKINARTKEPMVDAKGRPVLVDGTDRTYMDLSVALTDPVLAYSVGRRMAQLGIYSGLTGESLTVKHPGLKGKKRPALPSEEEVQRVLQELEAHFDATGDPTGTGLSTAGIPLWAGAERAFEQRSGQPSGAGVGVHGGAPGGAGQPGGVPALGGTAGGVQSAPAAAAGVGDLAVQRPAPLARDGGAYTSPAPTGERDLGVGAPFYGESDTGVAASPLAPEDEAPGIGAPVPGGRPAEARPTTGPGSVGPDPAGAVGRADALAGIGDTGDTQEDVAGNVISGASLGLDPQREARRRTNERMDQGLPVGPAGQGLKWVNPFKRGEPYDGAIKRVATGQAAGLPGPAARANHAFLVGEWHDAFTAIQQALMTYAQARGTDDAQRFERATPYGIWSTGVHLAVNVAPTEGRNQGAPSRIAFNPHAAFTQATNDLVYRGQGLNRTVYPTASAWKKALAFKIAGQLAEDIVHELTHNEITHNDHDADPNWTRRLRDNQNAVPQEMRAVHKRFMALLQENDFELLDQLAAETGHLYDAGVTGPRSLDGSPAPDPALTWDTLIQRGHDRTTGAAPGQVRGPGGAHERSNLTGAVGNGAGGRAGGTGVGRGNRPGVDASGVDAGGPRPGVAGGDSLGPDSGARRGAGAGVGVRGGPGDVPGPGGRAAELRGGGPGDGGVSASPVRSVSAARQRRLATLRGATATAPGGAAAPGAGGTTPPGGAAGPPRGAAPGGPGGKPGATPAPAPAPGGVTPQKAPSGWETAGAASKLSMLLSPNGLLRQLTGNVGTAVWQPFERAAAGLTATGVDRSGRADVPSFRESGAMFKSYVKNFKPAMRHMKESLEKANTTATASAQGATAAPGRPDPKGAFHRTLANGVDAGFRWLSVFDAATRYAAGAAEQAALEERSRHRGAQGKAVLTKAEIKERVQKAKDYRTLTQELDDHLSKSVDEFSKIPVVGSLVVPFWKIPYNGLKYDLERSPLGLGKAAFDIAADRGGARTTLDRTEMYERLARGTMGSALSMGLMLAMATGTIRATGEEPDDPEELKQWRAENKSPFSVNVGGRWVPVTLVPGLNAALTQASALNDIVTRHEAAGKAWDADAYYRAANRLVTTVAQYSLNRPFFEGLSEVLAGGKRQFSGAEEGGLLDVAKEQATGRVVPRLVREAERATSNVNRSPRDEGERILSSIPGLSESVPAARDAYGRPRLRTGSGLERALSPILGAQEQTSPRRYLDSKSAVEDTTIAQAARTVDKANEAAIKGLPVPPGQRPTARQKTLATRPKRFEYGQATAAEKARAEKQRAQPSAIAKMLAGVR